MAPRYHFRVITDSSHGTNAPTHIAPALSRREITDYHNGTVGYAGGAGALKNQLWKALSNDSSRKRNPFVFTTASFLYALQHAIDKASKGEENVMIICIDTWTAERTDGDNPSFHSVVSLGNELDMPEVYAHWTEEVRDFSDVYVTTDDFHPGLGSFYASLETLKGYGLLNLFPEFGVISGGLEAPVTDLWESRFLGTKDLSFEEIEQSAKLTMAYRPVCGTPSGLLDMHIFSWFLALKSQEATGKNLTAWLNACSVTPAAGALQHVASDERPIPEMESFVQIYNRVANRQISTSRLTNLIVNIAPRILQAERDEYLKLRTRNSAKRDAKAKAVKENRHADSLKRKTHRAEMEEEEVVGEEKNELLVTRIKRRRL
jgi:hypothetical protein